MFRSILIIFNFKKLHDFPFYIQTKLYKTWIPALLLHDQMLFFPLWQVPLTALHIVVIEKIYSGQLYKQTK